MIHALSKLRVKHRSNAPPFRRGRSTARAHAGPSWNLVAAFALAALSTLAREARAADPLPPLGVGRDVTVSGLSSGGFMAAQFAVAFSREVKGVGVIHGGPYDCALGWLPEAMYRCGCAIRHEDPAKAALVCTSPTPSVLAARSAQRALGKAAVDLIDPIDNLKQQRVWLFSGSADRTVEPAVVKAVELFYVDGMKAPRANVRVENRAGAGHGMPVLDAPGAVACGVSRYPYINDCDFDAAGDLLAWMYPGSTKGSADKGRLIEFDQGRYLNGHGYTGLASTGYVYVPDACGAASAACRLHVVFHGCRQGRDAPNPAGGTVGATFAANSGYNSWAAGSRIVVLYPQVAPVDAGSPFSTYRYNPRGCWDFWGYTHRHSTTGLHVTKYAPQMLAVRAMIEALQRKL